jgi:uncharacterized protein (DUF58 family)
MSRDAPSTSIDLSLLQQFESLELLAQQVVEGFIVGLHKSPFHGFSVEFSEHRLYNTGESTRNIDWKVYARTEKLFTKKYEEETNLRCQVLIDRSSSMYFPGQSATKLQFSIYAAAALMHLLRKQRDAVGLSVFSDSLEQTIGARGSASHLRYLYTLMEQLLAEAAPYRKTTAAAETLHQIADTLPRRSLVVIFSDMLDNVSQQEDLFSSLQHLRFNQHEVILFHVFDGQYEQELELEDRPYRFVDLETGEALKAYPSQIQEAYRREIDAFFEELRLRCGQFRIDYVPADIRQGFAGVLQPFLVKRKRMP